MGGALAGQQFMGSQMIQVGERPPGDPNYDSSEVIMAPPGTVVAPVPKGMAGPNGIHPNDALKLILMQLLKTIGGQGQTTPAQGAIQQSAEGSYTQPVDPMAYLSQLNNYAGTATNFNLGKSGQAEAAYEYNNSFNRQSASDIAGQQLARDKMNLDFSNDTANRSLQLDLARMSQGRNGGGGGGGGGYSFGDSSSSNSLALGLKQLEEQMNRDRNDYALGQDANNIRRNEVANTLALGTRQYNLQQASDEFNRIMKGVSEAALGSRSPVGGTL